MNAEKVIKRYYIFQFLSGFHMFSAVLIPFYTEWGGVTMAVAQGLQSWFMFCIFLLEVPTGVVADMVGRKNSLAVGSLITVVATLVYGSYPHIALFIIAEFLFAVGVAFMSGADKALLYDTLIYTGKKDEASFIFGRSRSIHLVGIALSAVVGSVAAKYLGINAPMLLTSIPALLAAGVAFSISEPADSGKVKEQRNFLDVLRKGFLPLRNNSTLRKWTINATVVATAAYFTIWLYQPVMKRIDIPLEYYGIAHAGLVMVQVVVAANFTKLIRLFGSLGRYLNFSALLVGLGFVLVAFLPSLFTLCIFLAFAGGFGLTRLELMSAEMNKLISSAGRATTLSSISMVQRISISAMNPLVGFLTDRSIVFSLLAVSMLPLLTLFVPIKEKEGE